MREEVIIYICFRLVLNKSTCLQFRQGSSEEDICIESGLGEDIYKYIM
jgi:hypothetical protein